MPLIAPESSGGHRYGIVLLIAVLTVVFFIVAPNTAASRAVGLLLSGGMLLVVVVTSRGDAALRERVAVTLSTATVAVAVLVIVGTLPGWIASAAAVALLFVTVGRLIRGLIRLMRQQGVTVQAVAGALGVYLLLGILFSLGIGVAAKLGHGPYFAQGTDGSESQHVYFSFTTLTTTGYGDLSPATSGGRALSVLEMLLGQIYLVTVISLLVSNLRRGAPAS